MISLFVYLWTDVPLPLRRDVGAQGCWVSPVDVDTTPKVVPTREGEMRVCREDYKRSQAVQHLWALYDPDLCFIEPLTSGFPQSTAKLSQL